MKKSNFMQGAFIATFGIFISKILGIIYVIPFYAMIGTQGGALYGYAYNIYSIFLSISTAGVPFAMSKIISEYNALGYYKAKEDTFKIGKLLLNVIGIISFIMLFLFAKPIAHLIIGDISGGNTLADVVYVIRIISFAILIVPLLSVTRGYLQGHRFIDVSALSQVLEQLVRVIIIIVGSFMSVKVFNLDLKTTVGVALLGATIGAVVSYFYLLAKLKKSRQRISLQDAHIQEPKVRYRHIMEKIILYALPFVLIDLSRSLVQTVDTFSLVRILVNNLKYDVNYAETVISIITTWGNKLNTIVVAITTGIMISLVPNLTIYLVENNLVEVRKKVNQTLQLVLYLTIPMTVGLSFLSQPVWMLFYGNSQYGPQVFLFFVLTCITNSTLIASCTMALTLKENKSLYISLGTMFLLKLFLNKPLIYCCYGIGLPGYVGSIIATFIAFLIPSFMITFALKKKFAISYEKTIKEFFNIVLATSIMVIVLMLVEIIIPLHVDSRLLAIPIIIIYAIVGSGIYFFITKRTHTISNIFGDQFLVKIFRKFKRVKK